MIQTISRFTILCLLGVTMLACNSNEEAGQPAEEEPAPEPQTPADVVEQATFTDLEGDTVSISEFEGKVVMIDLWETWCKPCLASFPTMQDLQEEYPEDFIVLAVTPGFTDTPEDARSFAQENDYDFIYLYDSQRIHEKLEVQGIPYKIFVDAEGNFIQGSMGSHGPEEDYKIIRDLIEQHKAAPGGGDTSTGGENEA